jgi:hypothetical protein
MWLFLYFYIPGAKWLLLTPSGRLMTGYEVAAGPP